MAPTSCSGTTSPSRATRPRTAPRWRRCAASSRRCWRCSAAAPRISASRPTTSWSRSATDSGPATRPAPASRPELFAQFPILEEALAALGIAVWPMVEYEADDALATAAAIAAGYADQVLICTPDKDLSQCVVGDRVVQLDRRAGTVRDEGGVIAKFGVAPASIPDYLALVGDSADGFPGLPGWGAKSAAAVLSRFSRIEAIPPDPAALGRRDTRRRRALGDARGAARAGDAVQGPRDAPHDGAARRRRRTPALARPARGLRGDGRVPRHAGARRAGGTRGVFARR